MNEEGYTATEALVALAILGLAVGGLTGGLKVIGQGQLATGSKITNAVSIRTASSELHALLEGQGPFRSDAVDSFTGSARRFSFPCGSGACTAQLTDIGLTVARDTAQPRSIPLRNADRLTFSYLGSETETAIWPSSTLPPPTPQWQLLTGVVLQDGSSGETLATTSIPIQQAANCEYDSVIQDCRRPGP